MRDIFRSISRQMTEELRNVASELTHSGMKGAANEDIFRGFLSRFLPAKYAIGQGTVVDFSGKQSKQIDVLLYDRINAVPLYVDSVNLVLPVEAVYGCVEVKAHLTKNEFSAALVNAQSVYNLAKPVEFTHVRGGVVVREGSCFDHPRAFVLGLNARGSTGIKRIFKQYVDFCREHEIHYPLVRCCAILNDGCFVDLPGKQYPCEAYLQENTAEDTLLFFFLNLVGVLGSMKSDPQTNLELYANYYKQLLDCRRLPSEKLQE